MEEGEKRGERREGGCGRRKERKGRGGEERKRDKEGWLPPHPGNPRQLLLSPVWP
jgi:hypothetical protein